MSGVISQKSHFQNPVFQHFAKIIMKKWFNLIFQGEGKDPRIEKPLKCNLK